MLRFFAQVYDIEVEPSCGHLSGMNMPGEEIHTQGLWRYMASLLHHLDPYWV